MIRPSILTLACLAAMAPFASLAQTTAAQVPASAASDAASAGEQRVLVTGSSKVTKAYAGGQLASGGSVGLLGDKSVMETPFNVSNYTSTFIENQQARSVADVLANDPSTTNLKAAGNDYDAYSIRGFSVGNPDIAFAGLYGVAPAQRTFVEGLDRIEVIKGPNAMLTGINPGGSVGGSINLVPKRAQATPTTTLTESVGSGGEAETHLDMGRRFGENGELGARTTEHLNAGV